MKRREVGEKKSSKKLVTVVMPAMIVMTLVTALFVVSATAGIDTFTNDTWNNWGNSATRAVNVTVVGLKGDINGDGKVTGIDAMKIKQYIAGLITLTPEQ